MSCVDCSCSYNSVNSLFIADPHNRCGVYRCHPSEAWNGSLSDHAKQSLPHLRTRNDHSTELAEDYVEAIAEIAASHGSCRVVDLAKHFGVSHVTVNRTVGRLQNEGLVKTEPYKPVGLTAKGARLAVRCRERHEIVYQFLLAIGVDPQTAAIDAEGIEHHVSPATLRCFVNWSKTNASIS